MIKYIYFFNDYPSNNTIESPIFIFVSPLKVFIFPLSCEIVFLNECLDSISLDGVNVDLIVFKSEERHIIIVWYSQVLILKWTDWCGSLQIQNIPGELKNFFVCLLRTNDSENLLERNGKNKKVFISLRFRNTLRGLTKTRGELPVFSSCESFESPVERMMVKAGYWLNILATFSMMTADCPMSSSSKIRKWFLLNVDSVGGGAFLSSLTVGMLSKYLK